MLVTAVCGDLSDRETEPGVNLPLLHTSHVALDKLLTSPHPSNRAEIPPRTGLPQGRDGEASIRAPRTEYVVQKC